MGNRAKLRIAAVSDIHCGRSNRGELRDLFMEAADTADVLLLCGDLTDHGRPEEVEMLAEDLDEYADVPILGVLGNHDFECGEPEVVVEVMREAGVEMLDGDSAEIDGVGFAGTSGFGGGFGEFALNAWGEPLIKDFVRAAIDEKLKLERALSRLETETRIVLLHYAPIAGTVEGEPEQIYPFLGSSRLEPPLDQYGVTAVFHGHAHAGTAEGRTAQDVPVYNVSLPVLQAAFPDRPPFRVVEVPLPEARRPKTVESH